MRCAEYRESLVEAARGGEVPAHAGSCAECGAFLARQIKLTAAMAELRAAADRAAMAACPAVVQRRQPVWKYAAAAGALAASVALAWLIYPSGHVTPPVPVQQREVVQPVRETAPRPPVVAASVPKRRLHRKQPKAPEAASELPAFVSIPYTVPFAKGERAEVWRVDLPLRDLIAAGAPISARDTDVTARADVVVGEDGRARAFRLISVSDSSTGSTYK